MNLKHLLDIQDIDNHLQRVKKEIENIPHQIELQKARLNQLITEEKGLEQKLTVMIKEKHALELDLKTREEDVRRLQGQQFSVKTNELFNTIKTEIAQAQKAVSLLEDKILNLIDIYDKTKSDQIKLKAQVDQEKQRFNEVETKLLTEKRRLEELYGASSTERQEKMKQISPELQRTYERIITKYPGSAVVLIKYHVCQGCFMSLPPNTMNEVRQSEKAVRCESCSRILYYDEEKSEKLD